MTIQDKELLEKCKDDASKECGYSGWGDPKMGLSASLRIMNHVAELYSSRQREEDRKLLTEIKDHLDTCGFLGDGGDLYKKIKAVLNP